MPTVSEAFLTAVQHYQAGRPELAAEICRRIVEAEPNHAETLHMLGVIAHQSGRHAEGVDYLRRAVALNPQAIDWRVNLGRAYAAAGDVEQGVECCRQALMLRPDDAELCCNLGMLLKQQGKLDEAVAAYRRALAIRPDYVKALNALGNALLAQGKVDEAVACYQAALQRDPHYAGTHYNLGLLWHAQGMLDAAGRSYQRAVELRPDFVQAWHERGQVLQDQGQLALAAECYRQVLKLNPAYAPSYNNLGIVLLRAGRIAEAIHSFQHALRLEPQYSTAHNNLGNALKDLGQLSEAIACYRRAIRSQPDFIHAHSNLLLAVQCTADVTPGDLLEAWAEFDRCHAAPLRSTWRPHANPRDPDKTLRLGFVSSDFERHPVGYYYLRPLEGLHAENCHVICYATRAGDDDFTARFRAAAHTWRDAAHVSDEALAEQIRADGVDILFDLAGHAEGGRLRVFARKPAPIQIAWAGPTGLSAIDYVLADGHLIPPGAEANYRETPLRMPDAYGCYEPPTEAPPVGPLPALERGCVTFGSLNNLAKITRQVLEAWGQILRRLPTSRLVIRYGDAARTAEIQQRLQAGFAAQGVDPTRVELVGLAPYAERLNIYRDIDLVLDAFPFSGCTTTAEALWMGVPVVTVPGEVYMSRQSLSMLRTVGVEETIAHDVADYVERAVALAQDLAWLRTLRAELRPRMAASPLCDQPRFVGRFLPLMQDVWRTRCRREGA
jgi:predicted O-linked N-acetylglucosamine transferase (SPINDLY family)